MGLIFRNNWHFEGVDGDRDSAGEYKSTPAVEFIGFLKHSQFSPYVWQAERRESLLILSTNSFNMLRQYDFSIKFNV